MGPSGSGKTTIVRLLFRLYDANDGAIFFSDSQTDIRQLKLHSLRQSIGIVPQDTVLFKYVSNVETNVQTNFSETILYNIRFGRPDASDADVEEAAKAAAIHNFILSHPDGLELLKLVTW